eukprot:gene30314-36628_t
MPLVVAAFVASAGSRGNHLSTIAAKGNYQSTIALIPAKCNGKSLKPTAVPVSDSTMTLTCFNMLEWKISILNTHLDEVAVIDEISSVVLTVSWKAGLELFVAPHRTAQEIYPLKCEPGRSLCVVSLISGSIQVKASGLPIQIVEPIYLLNQTALCLGARMSETSEMMRFPSGTYKMLPLGAVLVAGEEEVGLPDAGCYVVTTGSIKLGKGPTSSSLAMTLNGEVIANLPVRIAR